ncbi:hypothetical protein [Haloarcula rara]|uniref:hypothetical protein n=1 Tax=Haloarcula rara TaxID=3033387 RepID=UPI0023E88AE4|nr:hypothetical protein [Halomicroarcula sp. SHR3]
MSRDEQRSWRDITRVVTVPLSAVGTWLRSNRVTMWVVFWGRRSVVSLALLGGVFLGFTSLALVRPLDMERLLSDTATVRTLFSVLLSGAILIVSVVSSISSIVLSEEITDIETTQERIDASIEFRRKAENLAEVEGSPGQPAAFLEVILYTIYRETRTLREVAEGADNDEFTQDIRRLTETVLSEAKQAGTTLDGARFGTFKVLSAGLNYDHSWQLNTARRIQNRHEEALTQEQSQALTDLIDTLKLFATGRQYFQSLYYKREVARLSGMLLYVSLPVIIVISYLMLAVDETIMPESSVGLLSGQSVFLLAAYTLSLAPYIVLTAHVLRIAAITLRTLAAGPFTIGSGSDQGVVETDLDIDPESWEAKPESGPGDEGAQLRDSDRVEP